MIPQDFLKTVATERAVSAAEMEALSLTMEGQSTKAIALQLDISEDAVRKRLSEIYQKFQISGRGPVKLAQLQQLLVALYQEYKAHKDEDVPSHLVNSKKDSAEMRHDWGEAPDVSVFYGRLEELETLEKWIVEDKCRLVALLGMGGIGKSYLTVKLARNIQDKFDFVIWRSLRNAPKIPDLLADLLKFLSDSQETDLPKNVEEGISQLIAVLRDRRILLILDDVETILRSGDRFGRYNQGYEGYGILLKRVGEEQHQSCLVLSSQEKPREISLLESPARLVRSLKLEGLKPEDARHILLEKGLTGEQQWDSLIQLYRGNPLALKLVSSTIKEVFNKDVKEFLKLGTITINQDYREILYGQFERLSFLEKNIIFFLASESNPVSLSKLQDNISTDLTGEGIDELIEALESLAGRSLLEKDTEQNKKNTGEPLFTLQPVIKRYVAKYQGTLNTNTQP